MLFFNLLCIICASIFNVSNIKSNVIQNDIIYEKQEITPKRAFTNDEYTSEINGLTAYRFTNMRYRLGYFDGKNFEGRVSIDNGSYQSVNTTYALDLKSISAVNTYAWSDNSAGDWVTLFAQNTSIVGYNTGVIFRFFAPGNSKCENIEWKVVATSGNLGVGIGYGLGNFTESQDISLAYNPVFLLNSFMNLSNNIGSGNVDSSRHFRFCDYYFAFLPLDTSAYIEVEVNLLGAFDRDYQSGYNTGYANGEDAGYNSGFQVGYASGFEDADNMDATALTIFTGILEVGMLPVNVFLAIFNFEVFGINISGIVSALLTVSVVIIIIRFLLGGKTKDD